MTPPEPIESQEPHSLILELLHVIDGKVDNLGARQEAANGRTRKNEVSIGRLQWAVFGGGTVGLGVLWYLVQLHLR
jgi:hypothetical protein